MSRNGGWAVVVILCALGIGCGAVGPDYHRPKTVAPSAWHTSLEGGLTRWPADLAGWWRTFDDPMLSDLIGASIRANSGVKEAAARVREARARRGISGADRYPVLDASGEVTRSRTGGGSDAVTLYSAGFDAGWELDLFGGVRRSVEAADADLGASEADLTDVLVSLLAEVAINYLDVRTYQARLAVAEANLAVQEATFDMTRYRSDAGLSPELAVHQARANLERTRSQIPTLRTGLASAMNRLAVLQGKPPGAVDSALTPVRPVPVPPAMVAVGIPAETLRRRPDIRRAEHQLAAQNARVGVATAELYPELRLTGAIGLDTRSLADWLNWDSRSWRIGPGISWRVFDAGAVRRSISVQSALQEQALHRYEATVLTALEEVENALTAYAEEQVQRASLRSAAEAARRAERLAQQQYAAGLVDFSEVLIAQQSLLSLEDDLARSEGSVTTNLVRLYKALGGGWRPQRAEPPAGQSN